MTISPSPIGSPPDPGQLVEVRQRLYVVLDVNTSALPPGPTRPPQHLVSLSSIEDDALDEKLDVIWELEPGARAFTHAGLPEPVGFDDPHRLEAFLNAVRWGAISSADAGALQAPFRSGIEIKDYQLDPVVRALQMPRVNLLIADDVGLGKTIETGLVAQELILRHRAHTVLVVCPAGLQVKWRDEMRDRFGLEFRIVDSALLRDLRRRRGLHVNPWAHFPRLITSIDYLKRERPLRLFRELLPSVTYPRRFDLLIVDEAHNVAPAGTGRYATDSLRTLALRTIGPHFEHRLFLTATPHNGYPESFSALLELLDDQRFARAVPPDPKQLSAVMVRRLKSDLPARWDGKPLFPPRRIVPLEVDYPEDERRAHAALRRYSDLRRKRLSGEQEEYAVEFVLKLLKKRLFSSPAALAATLDCHARSLQEGRRPEPSRLSRPTPGILRRMADQIDEDFADDQALDDATAEAVEGASGLLRPLSGEEAALLAELQEYAARASARMDARARLLLDWLRLQLRPGGSWTDRRVLIFTEYRATQKWLHGHLAAAGLAGGDRLLTLYGGMPSDERERIKAAFQANPSESPVRILLATDAASEGIDLQKHCSLLVHYEIPWNPNRLEQRNGRIDRFGQQAPEVLIHHFVGRGYVDGVPVGAAPGDLEADLEFLFRAARKVEQIRLDLGKVGPVIASQVEEAMLGRRVTLDTALAEKEAARARAVLAAERRQRERIRELKERLDDSRRDLHLTPAAVQAAVEVALALAGQPPLRPVPLPGRQSQGEGTSPSPAFHLPSLTGTWSLAAEGLADPYSGRIRPLVFDAAVAEQRDDVVLAHLNHRLVQRCLGLLRAEARSPRGPAGALGALPGGPPRPDPGAAALPVAPAPPLHRVTARLVPSSQLDTPAVVAHGRLVILGGDNQRLHEELVEAGGLLREGRLSTARGNTLRRSLDAATDTLPPDVLLRRLAAVWPQVAAPLLAALQSAVEARLPGLKSQLEARCERQARDLAAILNELARAIGAELKRPADLQLDLWTDPEREQLDRNRASLQARLERIPAEIEAETAAIRARYADPTPRLFPIAVTFLVPEGL